MSHQTAAPTPTEAAALGRQGIKSHHSFWQNECHPLLHHSLKRLPLLISSTSLWLLEGDHKW